MKNEEFKFARKVRLVLDFGAENVDGRVAQRLFEARQRALGRQKVAIGGLQLAGFGGLTTGFVSGYVRAGMAIFALMAGVVSTYYWNGFEQAAENEEIDSALLADDLPPAAYLDKGFQAWLERSSQSSQQ